MRWPLCLETKTPSRSAVCRADKSFRFSAVVKTSVQRKGDADGGEEMQFYWGYLVSYLSV